jgi:hypothetical protein
MSPPAASGLSHSIQARLKNEAPRMGRGRALAMSFVDGGLPARQRLKPHPAHKNPGGGARGRFRRIGKESG